MRSLPWKEIRSRFFVALGIMGCLAPLVTKRHFGAEFTTSADTNVRRAWLGFEGPDSFLAEIPEQGPSRARANEARERQQAGRVAPDHLPPSARADCSIVVLNGEVVDGCAPVFPSDEVHRRLGSTI